MSLYSVSFSCLSTCLLSGMLCKWKWKAVIWFLYPFIQTHTGKNFNYGNGKVLYILLPLWVLLCVCVCRWQNICGSFMFVHLVSKVLFGIMSTSKSEKQKLGYYILKFKWESFVLINVELGCVADGEWNVG